LSGAELKEWLNLELGEDAEGLLLADGLEDAFLGVCQQFDRSMALYDYHKCVEIHMKNGMTDEEAVEYLDFNTLGAYVGEKTPAFLMVRLR